MKFKDVLDHLSNRGFITRRAWKGQVVVFFGMDNGLYLSKGDSRRTRTWSPELVDFIERDWVKLNFFWDTDKDDYLPFDNNDCMLCKLKKQWVTSTSTKQESLNSILNSGDDKKIANYGKGIAHDAYNYFKNNEHSGIIDKMRGNTACDTGRCQCSKPNVSARPRSNTLKSDVEEKVIRIISERLGFDSFSTTKVTLESNLIDDLGSDSLDYVEILMFLEDEFRIEIPTDTPGLNTVKDFCDYIEKVV